MAPRATQAAAALLLAAQAAGVGGFKAIVTGASGMVGSTLLHQLEFTTEGCEKATAVRRRTHGDLSTDEGAAALADTARDTGAAVIHCAATFAGEDIVDRNVRAAQAAVRAAAAAGGRLVFLSSMAAVRGPGQEPRPEVGFFTADDWNESTDLSTVGAQYQASKAQSEREAWRLAKELGVEMVSLCPSMIFGPPEDIGRCMESFSAKRVSQWMDGERPIETRLAVDVRDVVDACIASVTTPEAAGRRYIISDEKRVPAEEVAKKMRKLTFDTALEFDGAYVPPVPLGSKEVDSAPVVSELQLAPLRDGLDSIMAMAEAVLIEEERDAARRLYGVA
eukprot:CAMPEP_0118871808 /NCGR_PEP_ID=MMETSP1163-20130328/14246_1 /TAXON_ID=124430 /ORGANISM="Phaeomonas parva, Strain CCMP2877" /LENGTH=334 /DNA_ID=CAMNT_0006806943 /DNA_START=12 /DNA_END=1016 /DNA_ORIENTATION=+